MTLRDLIVDVVRTLWAHKLRAFLTMFGIAWGIVSIVLMVAAGEGLRKGQEETSRTLGKDVMIVFHGRTSLQAGGTKAGRLVHWQDEDVPVVQAETVDCQYAIPELEQETVLTHSNYNSSQSQRWPGAFLRLERRARCAAGRVPRIGCSQTIISRTQPRGRKYLLE
jgi:putative ABC transport system permease protein